MSGTVVLTPPAPPRRELVHACCYCGRVRTPGGQWHTADEPPPHPVSHGICRDCFSERYPDIPLPPDAK